MPGDTVKSLAGTEDRLPGRWAYWRTLHRAAARQFELSGYGEIGTPIIEDARLFVKGTGETTDIVEKEMYTLDAGGGERIALRPEGTPPAVRAYLESNLYKQRPFQKFWYAGPMFRRERPQKARLRQFHQIGIEAIGGASPLLDAEVILLAAAIYREVGLKQCEVWINSIGCEKCRGPYRDTLRRWLEKSRAELCEDCQKRLERNVLRVLDCKNEQCARVIAGHPDCREHLCDDCRAHYAELKRVLGRQGLAYKEDPRLVRGLDYYTRTVFEIKHPGLGARNTICGGGRYDGLVELLGGPSVPCVGFALGVEASILAMEAELGPAKEDVQAPAVYVVCFEEGARARCLELVQALRAAGVSAEMDYEGRSAKAQMKMADRLGSPYCFLIGERELAEGQVLVKEMATGEQRSVPWDDAAREMQSTAGRASGQRPAGKGTEQE